jgi:hypothetical protein
MLQHPLHSPGLQQVLAPVAELVQTWLSGQHSFALGVLVLHSSSNSSRAIKSHNHQTVSKLQSQPKTYVHLHVVQHLHAV